MGAIETWEARLAHAIVLVEVGETYDAEVEIAALLAERPDDLTALDLLGKVKHIRGELSAAVACWAQVQTRSPQGGTIHLRLVSMLALARDPERGAGEFLAVGRDQLWRKPAVHLELEDVFRLFVARRPDEARTACDRLAGKYRGRDPEVYETAVLAKAWIAELAGELDEARRILEGLGHERGFESDADRALALARVYEKLGTTEHLEAALHVAEFLDRHDERIVNVGRLALLHAALGSPETDAAARRFLEVFRRRMHRPGRAVVLEVAARRYLPLERIGAVVFPEGDRAAGTDDREQALALALDGNDREAGTLLARSPAPLDLRYRGDLARREGEPEAAVALYLASLEDDPDDKRVITWLLSEAGRARAVETFFSEASRADRAKAILSRAVHDFPLRPSYWRALATLYALRGETAEEARCAARAEALESAAARRRNAVGRALAASVYHFVGAAKGLIHEIWAQRRPAAAGRGGHLEEILGNVTAEMTSGVRNTFVSVREYALAKFPQQTADLFEYGYTYKVTKEDEPSGGLSAGLPTALAFLSVFLNRPLPQDVASSGVVIADAHDVLAVRPVGEPEYKVRGACNRNLRALLLPEGNRDELRRTPQVPAPIVAEIVRFVGDLDRAVTLVFGEEVWL